MTLDQSANRIRRLRALPEPIVHALFVNPHDRGLRSRIVVAQDLDERAVARGARIGHDDAKKRTLLRSGPAQTDGYHLNLQTRENCQTQLRIPDSYRLLRSICIACRRAFLPPPDKPAMPPSCFSIFCICTNCFSSRLTSSTDVPLPFAIRLRRLPLMMCCFRRSSGVIEPMMASMRDICFSSTCCPAICLMLPK